MKKNLSFDESLAEIATTNEAIHFGLYLITELEKSQNEAGHKQAAMWLDVERNIITYAIERTRVEKPNDVNLAAVQQTMLTLLDETAVNEWAQNYRDLYVTGIALQLLAFGMQTGSLEALVKYTQQALADFAEDVKTVVVTR